MTPQERQLVTDLFDRLAALENAPRDADAERAIADGVARAPHAVYALVQTALVQDEALKRADARIRELEDAAGAAAPGAASGGFLDSMRAAISGNREGRGSVPSVRPAEAPMGAPPGFQNQGAAPQPDPYAQAAPSRGGSFLGTAASAAAGVIGGALLLDGIRSMFGHGGGPFGAVDRAYAGDVQSPWGGSSAGSAADSDLARQAGLDDIGRGGGSDRSDSTSRGFGLFDNSDSDDRDADRDDLDHDDADDFDPGNDDLGGDDDFGGGDDTA
jgi:hypothetical protein